MTNAVNDALQLQDRLGKVIHRERECLNEILDLIIEAEKTRAYLSLGYSSLIIWLVEYYKYSKTAAHRRIATAFLKRSVPEIHEKIQSGAVNLTSVARTQTAIRAEEIRTKSKLSDDFKTLIIEKIEGKTGEQTEKILMTEFPDSQIFQKEKVKVINQAEVSLQIVMTHDEYEIFLRTKELLSHRIPLGSPGKIMAALCQEYNARKDPVTKVVRKSKASQEEGGLHRGVEKSGPVADSIRSHADTADTIDGVDFEHSHCNILNSDSPTMTKRPSGMRTIPVSLHREVFKRDQGSCQFRNHQTGRVCGSRHQIEIDHVQPFALGGTHEIENLRCLCAQHNRRRAEITFGKRRGSML